MTAKEIAEIMGDVFIPGSKTVQAKFVISAELLEKMATAVVAEEEKSDER